MKKLTQIILTVLGATLVLSASQLNYASAMQSHTEMEGAGQMEPSSTGQDCLISCASTIGKKEDILRNIEQDDDKDTEPNPPFCVQRHPVDIGRSSRELEQFTAFNPYSKIPLYKLCGVVRR